MTNPTSEIHSVNPATNEIVGRFQPATDSEVEAALGHAQKAFEMWRSVGLADRAKPMHRLAEILRERVDVYAELITEEMGKPITQSRAEIEKTASQYDYYADHAAGLLEDEMVGGLVQQARVVFEPLGVVLAVMPWNFPFSQVSRFAAPAVMAGNAVILKHASNVSKCSLAIAQSFRDAGFPDGTFQSLVLPSSRVAPLIADHRVRAVTVTGSSEAGARIAEAAGGALKKSVLELGGSDPFIVLGDADLELTIAGAVRTRLSNSGQACAAGKRFIVDETVAGVFEEGFATALAAARLGDPRDDSTQVGPLARADLLDTLEAQVRASVDLGARVVVGGRRRPEFGCAYEPTLLSDCTPDMPVLREETFGPVAAMITFQSTDEAIRLANDTPYGLGATIWSRDVTRARSMAHDIQAGAVVVNGIVTSDPRLPFGGVKQSGYGREQSRFGIREFVNIQTVVG